MAKKKTVIDEEIEERADYFADWVRKLSSSEELGRVVNERTAREQIRNAFASDPNLSNLLEGMDSTGKGMKTILKTSYIQDLISAGQAGKKLDEGVARLRKKRQSLEKLIPKKQTATRKAVINKFTTATHLRKYDVAKNKAGQYINPRTGRYVSFDRILKITDLTILSSAKKRKEFDKFVANMKKK